MIAIIKAIYDRVDILRANPIKKIIDLKTELRKGYSDDKLIQLYQAIEELEKKIDQSELNNNIEELQEK